MNFKILTSERPQSYQIYRSSSCGFAEISRSWIMCRPHSGVYDGAVSCSKSWNMNKTGAERE